MSSLDWRLPRFVRLGAWLTIGLVPSLLLWGQFSTDAGFAGLMHYGSYFYGRAIPQLRAENPPVTSPLGYDGQFYSQVALDPLLRTPELKTAMDVPAYRAVRIGMPVLAHVLGLGKPFWVLQCYALLNVAFWYALLFGLWRFLRPATLRDHLCVFAICLTSGAIFSIQRALLDLPAMTLAFYGASLAGGAVPAFVAAILTKSTYALALVGLPGIPRDRGHRVLRFAGRVVVILLPMLCWYLYVQSVLGLQLAITSDFSLPFEGYFSAITKGYTEFDTTVRTQWIRSLSALLAPVSLLVQFVWLLLVARRPGCRYWRIGCAFAVASAFLSYRPFVEPMSYCRDTIAMPLAFNIGLMRHETRWFLHWFIAGNTGLMGGLAQSIQSWLLSAR